MFLCAKTASAATAALGFAGYFLNATGFDEKHLIPIALGVVVVLTLIVCGGIRLSNRINIVIVSTTLFALMAFVFAGASSVSTSQLAMTIEPASLMNATALMFVAYTGYGRIATLGEEVIEPRRTIPRAIIFTLLVSMLVYGAVAIVAVGTVGADRLFAATTARAAPLEIVSREFPLRIHWLVAIGAMTAMLGVLLNLLLGLSRVFLAMGRRGDMPSGLTNISIAVLATGSIIGGLVLIGNVKTTWSFSAFTVLIYYAVTNLAALQLKKEDRLYPRALAVLGLFACLCLAFSIERNVWLGGLAVLAAGLLWYRIRKTFLAK
jgi:basic amino acid/polyamine antiporter, APA family